MSDTPNRVICGAKTRSGRPCQQPPMKGRTRCKNHGGASLRGIEHPNWQGGRFSRFLGPTMGQLAYEAAHSTDLFDMREIIGVYEARIQHLLSLEKGGLSGERAIEIKQTWRDFREAQQNRRTGTMLVLADKMDELTADLDHDGLLWKEIDVAAKNYKLLLESERKRQIEAHQLIPVLKAADFAREILSAVRNEVTNPAEWSRVQARIEDVMSHYSPIIEADNRRADQEQGVHHG